SLLHVSCLTADRRCLRAAHLPHRHPFLFAPRRPPISTLFPYTTLSRSHRPNRPTAQCCWHEVPAPVERGQLRAPGRSTACSDARSEEHTSELQSLTNLVCRLLLEKKKSRQDEPTPGPTHIAFRTNLCQC